MRPEHRYYLESENEELRLEVARLKATLTSTLSDVEQCRLKLVKRQGEICDLKTNLVVTERQHTREMEKMKDHAAALDANLENEQTEIEALRAEIRDRDHQLAAARESLDETVAQRSELDRLREEKSWRDAAHKEEKLLRENDIARWGSTSPAWTRDTAVDRALFVLDEFSTKLFSKSRPLTFSAIPWPVLGDIQRLSPTDMTWTEVDDFFRHAKRRLQREQYKDMGNRMRRVLHPDAWIAKNLIKTVYDKEEGQMVEEAGVRVSQAVNTNMAEL